MMGKGWQKEVISNIYPAMINIRSEVMNDERKTKKFKKQPKNAQEGKVISSLDIPKRLSAFDFFLSLSFFSYFPVHTGNIKAFVYGLQREFHCFRSSGREQI